MTREDDEGKGLRRTYEHQPPALLRTLLRLDDQSERLLQAENDVERDLDHLIALKNRELKEVYGIPAITTFFSFFFPFHSFSLPAFIILNFFIYSAFPCSSHVCIN